MRYMFCKFYLLLCNYNKSVRRLFCEKGRACNTNECTDVKKLLKGSNSCFDWHKEYYVFFNHKDVSLFKDNDMFYEVLKSRETVYSMLSLEYDTFLSIFLFTLGALSQLV